ncbi:trehalase-like isoform X2 [Paramacrobiotus metropolitanus]|nr:trehalase-like isoform X2 [Paramacrobiotus metropolitanus]XP_055348796.1 trehalase-like isoform X2 [Paramacrobiotus metropolitanus]
MLRLFLITFILICFLSTRITAKNVTEIILPCSSRIYCGGPLLKAIQRMHLYNDSKTFVDLPMFNRTEEEILENFAKIDNDTLTKVTLMNFIMENFMACGAEMMPFRPADYRLAREGGLALLHDIQDPAVRKFAAVIHNKWDDLGRYCAESVARHPEQHSLIYVPHPFIIPGGRFREIYYWDSFWVIQGLMVSNMADTALGMLRNIAHLIHRFGHMPNGNRVYYQKRSQPPVFALMVDAFCQHPSVPREKGLAVVQEMLPYLEKEYKFWMTERRVDVSIRGKIYTMNRYRGGMNQPRPEMYREDVEQAALLKNGRSHEDLYSNIAAAAESGIDFSTRWLDNQDAPFNNIRTKTILPVDLNAFLCAQERLMGTFYDLTGNAKKSALYHSKAKSRGSAMHDIFWNEELSMWRDYDLQEGRQRTDFYLSSIAPLFTQCTGSGVNITTAEFANRVLKSDDITKISAYPGGFPESLSKNARPDMQWDYANAWPPHQLMLVESFAQFPETRSTALQFAQKYFSAVYAGYNSSGYFFEKYDVNDPGKYGGGGEYQVQEGFGWTNGGILRLIELFPGELTVNYNHTPSSHTGG